MWQRQRRRHKAPWLGLIGSRAPIVDASLPRRVPRAPPRSVTFAPSRSVARSVTPSWTGTRDYSAFLAVPAALRFLDHWTPPTVPPGSDAGTGAGSDVDARLAASPKRPPPAVAHNRAGLTTAVRDSSRLGVVNAAAA